MGSLISTNNDKDFDNVKSKYFSLIDQLIKQNYENNISEKRLRANISICFENKYFDEINYIISSNINTSNLNINQINKFTY
jgi:hypothetical protein